ncbi:MAG: hemolysin family protein [Nitrospirota bacterium]
MIELWLEIIFIFILILTNGLFASSEIATIAANKGRITELAKQGDKKAGIVKQLQNDPERFLATVQIGITIVGSLAAAIGGITSIEVLKPLIEQVPINAVQRFSEPLSICIVVLILSYLTLIIGELVPKSIALRYPEKIAIWTAVPVDKLSKVSSIFIKILTTSSNLILKPFGNVLPLKRSVISEEEIKFLLKKGREEGVFGQTEQELIHSVFEFTDISVREVMVPGHKIHAIKIDTDPEEALKYIAEHKFSRYPLYIKSINEICGLLYYKDLFETFANKKKIKLKNLLHPVYFVPDSMQLSNLLKELQKRRIQMAVVVNEYGTVDGLVTMEDVIEEIVGEIRDEYEVEESPVERLKDGSLLIDASLSIRDLEEYDGMEDIPIPESTEYETVGGFIISRLQKMPKSGEIVYEERYKFTIVDMEGIRIAKIKAEKTDKEIK